MEGMKEEDMASAFTGAAKTDGGSESTDWKRRCEEAERELQANRVEHGRLKKTVEELEAAKRELAELRASNDRDELRKSLTEDDMRKVPDEILDATSRMVEKGMGKVKEEYMRNIDEMKARREAEDQAARKSANERFVREVEARFPGFFDSISAGGDKAKAWSEYYRFNRSSIGDAYASHDIEGISYHLKRFYEDTLGIPAPSGNKIDVNASAQEPRSAGVGGGAGGTPTIGNGRVYTVEEYLKALDAAEVIRNSGNFAEYQRVSCELRNAMEEGRVKEQ